MSNPNIVAIPKLPALAGGLIACAILPHSLLAESAATSDKNPPFTEYINKAKQDAANKLDRQFRLTTHSWGNVFIWGGAQLANPYSIQKKDDGDLKKGAIVGGNSQFQGFVSANVNLRYVLRGELGREWSFSTNSVPPAQHAHSKSIFGLFGLPSLGFVVPDIDVGISYLFQGEQPETLTAATVASTADVGGYVDLGYPLVRWHGPHQDHMPEDAVQQMTIEGGLSLATDKHDLQIQQSKFLGLGYQGVFRTAPLQRFIWISKLGYSWGETPEVDAKTGLAQLNVRDQIQYTSEGAFAASARFIFELTESLAVQAGASAFFYRDLPTWTISIGFSLDPTKAFSK